jgi:hypothetical protein
MQEYKLIVNNFGVYIVDQDGNPIPLELGREIARKLGRKYARLAYVYLLYHTVDNIYKIGFTAQPVKKRLSQISYKEVGSKIEMFHTFSCESTSEARDLELVMHGLYDSWHVRGEWYDIPSDEITRLKACATGAELLTTLLPLWRKAADPSQRSDRRFFLHATLKYETPENLKRREETLSSMASQMKQQIKRLTDREH